MADGYFWWEGVSFVKSPPKRRTHMEEVYHFPLLFHIKRTSYSDVGRPLDLVLF